MCIGIRQGDADRYMIMLKIGLRICDLITDIALSVTMWEYLFDTANEENKMTSRMQLILLTSITACSSLFIIIPFLINIRLTINVIRTVMNKKEWSNNETVKMYLLKFNKILFIFVLLTGDFYVSLELISSNFLSLKLFDCGITTYDLLKRRHHRLYSTILLENIPQLAIQIIFLNYQNKNLSSISQLTIIGMVFSALSVLSTIISYFSTRHLLNKGFKYYSVFISFNFHKSDLSKILKNRCYKRRIRLKLPIIQGRGTVEIGYIEVRANYQCIIHCMCGISKNESKLNFDKHSVRNSINDIFKLKQKPKNFMIKAYDIEKDTTMNHSIISNKNLIPGYLKINIEESETYNTMTSPPISPMTPSIPVFTPQNSKPIPQPVPINLNEEIKEFEGYEGMKGTTNGGTNGKVNDVEMTVLENIFSEGV